VNVCVCVCVCVRARARACMPACVCDDLSLETSGEETWCLGESGPRLMDALCFLNAAALGHLVTEREIHTHTRIYDW